MSFSAGTAASSATRSGTFARPLDEASGGRFARRQRSPRLGIRPMESVITRRGESIRPRTRGRHVLRAYVAPDPVNSPAPQTQNVR